MNLHELDRYKLSDAVKFNARLNPRLWGKDEHLKPEVRDALMKIADDFRESLGVNDLDLRDITLSGSNAAYTYTPNSDIDLHLVVDIPDDAVYRELFDAKKYAYNNQHTIKIGGYDVELYVQDVDQPHVTQGEYSLINNDWIQVPRRQRADVVDQSTRSKYQDLKQRIKDAIKTEDHDVMASLMSKIKQLRQSGLDEHGEFGPENLAFKMLRTQGYIQRLVDARNAAKDQELSIDEQAPRFTYGFGSDSVDEASLADMRAAFQSELKPLTDPDKEKVYRSRDEYAQAEKQKIKQQEIAKTLVHVKPRAWPGGTNEEELTSHNPQGMPEEAEPGLKRTIDQFAASCIDYLGIKRAPEIKLHTNTDWSEQTGSFGQYEPETNVLHLATSGRHTLDILRTMAHEFTHRKQAEKQKLPADAGETGSPYEDEANAMAGRIMRHWAEKHPEMFAHVPLEEASGYIPTRKQAKDPRFVMALTKDVRPGAVGKEANKLGLQTDAQGHPALLTATLNESLLAELARFKEQDLFEINMGSKNLRREAAKTGAIAGMEFEMIVPNVEGDNDGDQEPDYDYDQRCRSIQDAYDFFYDGDWNSRRSCDEMRDEMRDNYKEWLDEKISSEWDSRGEEYIAEWVKNNVDESDWNPDDLEGDARNEALEEYSVNVHADPMGDQYQQAYEEFREEHQEDWDESDWLDDADLDHMTNIENAYSMSWPHWTSPQGGEASIEDVAQEFENAIGRDVRASGNYHSGSVSRPSPTQIRYVVEPDGSLEPDDPNDQGLEFVSPPLPIDEILGDLNKVKRWAKEYGCYTNDSTGLHINISVPNYSRENLDFVKLALLMGDKYVLDSFGRSSNTYAKSALDIVKRHVRDNPEGAEKLLDKMKGNLDQLATKAIHSGVTSKYTSINTKDGHIEFRSPGGDWLDENFDQIENTLLRFTVAMSAALNPEAYRQEYLTKLYKMLSENNKGDDTIKYFSDYVAGKIPRAALRSFVKQAQLQRKVKRGKTDGQKPGVGTYELYNKQTGDAVPDTEFSARNEADQATRLQDYINHGQHGMNAQDASYAFGVRPVADSGNADQDALPNSLRPTGPGPWEIYNRDTGNSVMDLNRTGQITTDRGTAQRYAMNNINPSQYDNYGVRTRGTGSRANIGTQTDMENRLGLPSQSATANYAVIDRQTLDPVFRFQADDRRAANRIYGEWLAAAGLPQTTEDYGFQEIRPQSGQTSDRTDGSNINYSFRDLFGNNATADQQQGGIVDVAPDVAQNFGNQFSGQWKIVDTDTGEELYRFRGVGNSQADANRIAAMWLQQNGPAGADMTQIEVVPVMIESVQESLNEIEQISQQFFTGGKDELARYKAPSKKQLRPLPGGTDLMYSISNDSHGSYVTIVDPGMPGITRPTVVASLSLVPGLLPDSVQVGMITVDEDYRGRGLARALYGIVLTIMKKTLISGSSQTPGGRRNWLSLASIPGVEVKGLVALSNRDTDTTVGDPKSRYNKYVEKTIDRVMELGGQFVSRNKNFNLWAFDVVPGKGQLQPVVRNALSKLYGYDSDALLMATWTGV